jgi:hypothetical protein
MILRGERTVKNQDFFQQEYLLGQVTYAVYSDDDVEWIYEKGGDKGTAVSIT